jgi:hypothetical protein
MSEKTQKFEQMDLSAVGEEELVAELARRRASGPRTITEMEDAIEQAQAADGRKTMGTYLQGQSAGQREAAPCPKCGQPSGVRARDRERTMRTLTGEQTLRRHYHYCSRCRHGFYPLDAQLGVPDQEQGELTPKMRARVMDFAVNSPYAEAAERWSIHYCVPVSEGLMRSTVERTAEQWSAQPSRTLQGELRSAPARPSELLVVQNDGSMLPIRGAEPWKEAKVAVVYREEQHVASNDNAGTRGELAEARYVAAIGAPEFRRQLRVALRLERASEATTVAWVADGAPGNWTLAHQVCPKAVQILDWMHAVEHAVDCAKVLFGPDDPCVELWRHRVEQLLDAGDTRGLLAELSECWEQASRKVDRKALHDLLRYYRNNQKRMDYRRFRELGMPIGSGTVESAHRHVLQKRMKLAGQHWDLAHAKHMVRLRAAYKTAGPHHFSELVQRLAA